MGKLVQVRILSASKHSMKAELITDESFAKRPENVPPPLSQGQVSGMHRSVSSPGSGWVPFEYKHSVFKHKDFFVKIFMGILY